MSMTNEEAIERIKEIKDRAWGWHINGEILRIDYDKFIEIMDTALSALRPVSREQVEKVWRGEWVCAPNMGVYDTICSKCGYCPGITFWDSDFCPACGAPMTDKAVDMVMERLEEMRNG